MSDVAITSHEHSSHDESGHDLAPHIKIGRARSGVLLFMVSDVVMVLAVIAAGGWLSALNVHGMFKAPTDQPSFPPGLVVAVLLLVSALCYLVYDRAVRRGGSAGVFFVLALLLVLAALVIQCWSWTTLGYTTAPTDAPAYDAFQSLVILVAGFNTVHIFVLAVIGALLGGRIINGRIAGQEFIPMVVGYWWYYTVISGVILWLSLRLF
jgi:heme/copper-type cytochrome/quinol oxidase subunit 3